MSLGVQLIPTFTSASEVVTVFAVIPTFTPASTLVTVTASKLVTMTAVDTNMHAGE